MTTTLKKFGQLALYMLCAVAIVATSVSLDATTPTSKTKTEKAKKSKKKSKKRNKKTRSSSTTEKITEYTAVVPNMSGMDPNATVESPSLNVDTGDVTVAVEQLVPKEHKEYESVQPQPVPKPQREEVFKSCYEMPSFPGGDAALITHINKNIKYPTVAKDNGIQGKVVVQFVVEKDGSIGDVKIVRGVDQYLDREAVRVCRTLPKFNPGRNANYEPVRVWYTLPIIFKLTSK